jgi:hypothetical protein
MLLRSILPQYVLETLVFLGIAALTVLPMLKRRNPRKTLAVLTALNVLRFGGVAGALAAMARSAAPAALVQVAVGDGLTGALAVVALGLLLRGSSKASLAIAMMNVVGLSGILVSEVWLTSLELRGDIVRSTFLHGPTIGAAVYTTLHAVAFCLLGARRSPGAGRQNSMRPVHASALGDGDLPDRNCHAAIPTATTATPAVIPDTM